MTTPRRTALFATHEALGATFTDFGGWSMPLKYTSELAEHHAVRTSAGLFDLSHMGEVRVSGSGAAASLDFALVGRISAMPVGKAKYSLICAEDGGIIDDLIVYRLADEEYLVVPNAGNAAAVSQALEQRSSGFDATVTDETSQTSLIAVQGPASLAILRSVLSDADADAATDLAYYAAFTGSAAGASALIARTGYTGEDGFELFIPNASAPEVWAALMTAGQEHAMVPAGLACRDSLRLEAGMPLYGNELSLERNPFEAGLGAVVALGEGAPDFVGGPALRAIKAARAEDPESGLVLVGLKGLGRRAARPHQPVAVDGAVIGEVTSGVPSPTLGHPVALAYVARIHSAPGTAVEVDVRGSLQPFEVVTLPFYKRPR